MPEISKAIKDNYIFGLDIGTRTVVGIVGHQTAGSFNVIADYILEHDTRAMMDGQIHDVAKVSQTIKKVKLELEKQLGFTLSKVCIAAAGRVLKTKTVHVEQDVDYNSPINEDRVFAIELLGIEKAHQEINMDLDKNETGFHCVGYTVSKYYLNEYEISNLIGHKGKKIGADVLATFLPKEVIESLHQVVDDAGLKVHSLTLEPIAAINIAIPTQYRLLNIALVDIGAGTSDIAITKEGSIIAYGMIPFAGDEITETIVHRYLVDFKTAETIKIKSSGKSKVISYKDIMGMSHKVNKEDVEKCIHDITDNLAKKISEKIRELNGGQSTNAVFVVGGGGQVSYFTNILAGYLKIPSERVALRGKTVLDAVQFETTTKKTPELVTPLGICFSGFDHNRHEFVQVFLNDEPVKVFDTNNLTVMDIAAFKGFNPKHLIARRGEDLVFTFNKLEKRIRGEIGEPAQILINNRIASLNDRVTMNDYITIIPAKKGKDGALSTNQLLEQLNQKNVQINNTRYSFKQSLKCNNETLSVNYDIQNHDNLETINPTVKDLIILSDLSYNGQKIWVNGSEQGLLTTINDNDIIIIEGENVKNQNDPNHKEHQINDAAIVSIHVIVNGESILMNHKKTYVFVDIFDYYAFNLSKPQGIIECEINDQKASYMDTIHDGDQLKIYWSNK